MTVATNPRIQPLRLALIGTLFVGSFAYGAGTWDMPDTHPADLAPVTFSQLSAGSDHTLGLSRAGTVWSWGYNGKEQLGVPGLSQVEFPVRVLGGLTGKKVRTVLAAGEHSLALTENGEVYAWGNTSIRSDASIPVVPTLVEGALRNRKVATIGVGEYANYAITDDGELFQWFRDQVDANGTSLAEPVSLLPGHRMVKVAGGAGFAFAIDDSGALWGWGSGVGPDGELALSGTRAQPVQVTALKGKVITQLAAGGAHVLAGTAQGEVFAWGGNYWGQLGTGRAGEGADSPFPVALNRRLFTGKVVKLVADSFVSYAITDRGQLYAWGINYANQLPLPGSDSVEFVNTPTLVKDAVLRGGVVGVEAGYGHGVALAADGSVVAWGDNGTGQLGLGLSVEGPFTPTRAQPVTAPVSLLQPAPSKRVRITYPLHNGEVLKQAPTFYGTGAPGRAVTVEVVTGPGNTMGTTLCAATINSSGYWNCAASASLEPEQLYAIRARAFVDGRRARSDHVWFLTADY